MVVVCRWAGRLRRKGLTASMLHGRCMPPGRRQRDRHTHRQVSLLVGGTRSLAARYAGGMVGRGPNPFRSLFQLASLLAQLPPSLRSAGAKPRVLVNTGVLCKRECCVLRTVLPYSVPAENLPVQYVIRVRSVAFLTIASSISSGGTSTEMLASPSASRTSSYPGYI
jgi:hypothetical protein